MDPRYPSLVISSIRCRHPRRSWKPPEHRRMSWKNCVSTVYYTFRRVTIKDKVAEWLKRLKIDYCRFLHGGRRLICSGNSIYIFVGFIIFITHRFLGSNPSLVIFTSHSLDLNRRLLGDRLGDSQRITGDLITCQDEGGYNWFGGTTFKKTRWPSG
jgi:hypothetical protein